LGQILLIEMMVSHGGSPTFRWMPPETRRPPIGFRPGPKCVASRLFADGVPAREGFDMYPVENMWRARGGDRLQAAWLPPIGVLAQQRPCMVALPLRSDAVGQFLVNTMDHDAFPAAAVLEIVDLQADLRVLPHPFDLLAGERETVDVIVGKGE